MKGLLMKDLLWAKQQKKLLLILGILVVMYAVMDMLDMILGFIPLFLSLIFSKTILFDLDDRSSRFLFTLPFTRKQYVSEKYLLCIGVNTLSVLVVWAACFLLMNPAEKADLNTSALLVILTGIILISILIPAMVKYKQKSQFMLMAAALGLVLINLFLADPENGIMLPVLPEQWLLPLTALLALVLFAGSFWLSCHLMKKEEL